MEYLLDAVQMKQCDRFTIEEMGIPAMVLMERASLAVVEELLRAIPKPDSVLVVCGSGNNGGDGFAVARLLKERGIRVDVSFVGREASMTRECRMQRQICEKCGIKISSNFDAEEYTVIVDAIFGIGLSRPVTGAYAEVIAKINQSSARCVAVDIPSGIHADTGAVMGIAVRADLTVTFAAKKIGQILYPGAACCGTLIRREVGIAVEHTEAVFTCDTSDLYRLPERPSYSNKGSFGKVLLIAGSQGMSGAACLCAQAAYRSGCGLVRVFTPECNRTVIQTVLPEAMVTCYGKEMDALSELAGALAWADVIGIGPGLGTDETTRDLLRCVMERWTKPLVIDADGLNLLAREKALLELRRRIAPEHPVIVTPHVGEMMRLTGKAKNEILADLIGACREFAAQHSLICVEKDARTVVSDGRRCCINTSGNQGMAVGGSGDVLTGVLCGLLAQGMEPFEAAALGVYIHGLAGDAAKDLCGSRGMMAGDIARGVGAVLKKAEECRFRC